MFLITLHLSLTLKMSNARNRTACVFKVERNSGDTIVNAHFLSIRSLITPLVSLTLEMSNAGNTMARVLNKTLDTCVQSHLMHVGPCTSTVLFSKVVFLDLLFKDFSAYLSVKEEKKIIMENNAMLALNSTSTERI